jgi:hypothetical protein
MILSTFKINNLEKDKFYLKVHKHNKIFATLKITLNNLCHKIHQKQKLFNKIRNNNLLLRKIVSIRQ